ncbi:MAG: hypothetical protein LBV61_10595 [Burkholderiaceae bacterium]|jgi:hypothetical protein|nr:hypothetical protein [Burkholderiaceae bacterium]
MNIDSSSFDRLLLSGERATRLPARCAARHAALRTLVLGTPITGLAGAFNGRL